MRGWSKNLAFDQTQGQHAGNDREGHVSSIRFDLYVARHRRQFIAQAAVELGVEEQTIKKDLGRVLLKLEELQDEQITKMTEPHEPAPTMTPEEKDAALRLLRDPNLLDRIVSDFDVVGETTNKLVGYLAAVSRKLDQPLAVIIQSSSAAGKTSLMDAILSFVPPEDQVKYSAMTGQSLFYMGETDLKHKILAIVEEEGAERASYALKLLQSEGALTIASTGKDPRHGTAGDPGVSGGGSGDDLPHDHGHQDRRGIAEPLPRAVGGREPGADQGDPSVPAAAADAGGAAGRPGPQGNPGAAPQRPATAAAAAGRQPLRRILDVPGRQDPHPPRPPEIPDADPGRSPCCTNTSGPSRRPCITSETVEYIEVTLDDIAVANRLACEVLGRSVDELPPQTRRLLNLVDEMVTAACKRLGIDRADYRFSRRDIREFTGWGHTQLKVHLKRLEELEYLLVHRGGRGQSFVYELLYEPSPDAQSRFLARLIDVEQLRQAVRRKPGRGRTGRSRGVGGVKSASSRRRSRGRKIDASADGHKHYAGLRTQK